MNTNPRVIYDLDADDDGSQNLQIKDDRKSFGKGKRGDNKEQTKRQSIWSKKEE